MELSSILGLPLGLMIGAQFLTLMAEAFRYRSQMEPEPLRTTDCSDGNRYAYGIAGICEIFGCSRPTAQRLKKSAIIKDAIIQTGRTIIIDRQKALDLVKEDSENKKGGRRCKK